MRTTSAARIRLSAVCAVLAIVSAADLAAQRYTFRQYGMEQGLTNQVVGSLLQDRGGYLWVGTENGLFRYDGHAFRAFGHGAGLPNNEVLSLAESPEGVLWVATAGGAVRGGVKGFQPLDAGGPESIKSIAFDGAGRVYLAHPLGIVRGIPDHDGVYRFRSMAAGVTAGLFVDAEGAWFGKDGDVWRLSEEKLQRIGSPAGLPAGQWSSLVRDSNGNLWVRSSTRLFCLPKGQTRFVDRSDGISKVGLTYLTADRHGRVFVASDSGLVVLDGDRRIDIDAQHGLPADTAGPVLVDRDESLWLGTFGGGLVRRLGRGEWLSWKKEDGLPHNTIWAIHPDRAGQVWVGTSNGLTIINPRGRIERAPTSRGRLSGIRAPAIAEGRDGEIFVGMDPVGISHFSRNGVLLGSYGKSSGLTSKSILTLAVDRPGRLWAAGIGGCFRSRTSVNTGLDLKFERMDIPGIGPQTDGRDLKVDESGAVWMATSHGLARFDGKHWKVFAKADGLLLDHIETFAQGQGFLWVAYRDAVGISRLKIVGDRLDVVHFTKRDGLSSDQAFGLAFDPSDRMWVTTDTGVDVCDHGRWHHYGREDGLIWEDADSRALNVDREGNVWVGTSNGLSRYTPPPEPVHVSPPPAVLTSIEGDSREWDFADQPVLPYARRSLLIGFSALNYAYETRIRFRYRLDGYNGAWKETRERSVQFAGLPAGRYLFEVAAAVPNGPWSVSPARFAFSIQAPWWQSWWFVAACILMAALLGSAVWRFRVRALVAQKDQLRQLVADRTAELRESHRRLEEIAYRDSLTGLLNRRRFNEEFGAHLTAARSEGGSFALLIVDLDQFKPINDTFGHAAGDAVLIEVAVRLKAAVRESDCVARLGGDEFGILLTSAHDAAGIEAVCRRIVDSFVDAIPFKDARLRTTASIGAVVFPDHGHDQESLHHAADFLLYEAKRSGKNRFCSGLAESDGTEREKAASVYIP